MGTVYLYNTAAPDGTYSNKGGVSITGAEMDGNLTFFLRNDVADTAAGTITFSNGAAFGSTEVTQPRFKDYRLTVSALGTVTTSATANLANANYFTATANGAIAWTFSNPATSGTACGFILELANGGTGTQTFPSTRWAGGVAPTLTASGTDVLVFITDDGGTNWRAIASMLDSK